jgi:hypothetical protein
MLAEFANLGIGGQMIFLAEHDQILVAAIQLVMRIAGGIGMGAIDADVMHGQDHDAAGDGMGATVLGGTALAAVVGEFA